MKKSPLILVALLVAFASQAQPAPLPHPAQLPPAAPTTVAKIPVNYLIHVEWTEPKGDPQTLEVLTTEGSVEYDGLQKNSVKVNGNDVPVTLKLTGTISALNEDCGRLQLFLGRNVPYATGSQGSAPSSHSSYSQMSVGLQSTFIVRFGKPIVIQSDENGKITVLVKRLAD